MVGARVEILTRVEVELDDGKTKSYRQWLPGEITECTRAVHPPRGNAKKKQKLDPLEFTITFDDGYVAVANMRSFNCNRVNSWRYDLDYYSRDDTMFKNPRVVEDPVIASVDT